MTLFQTFSGVVRKHWLRGLNYTLLIVVGYYLALLLALQIRFGRWPNYATVFDWPANVATIWTSTPALTDRLMLIKEEWLLEVGYMNYDYGLGLSEWSLVIIPWKLLGILWLGLLTASLLCTLREKPAMCRRNQKYKRGPAVVGSVGAICLSMSSVSLYWVVCCSTPTWVVGLAMLGLGVSTSLWLEPLGAWISALGSLCLLAAVISALRGTDINSGFAAGPTLRHAPGEKHEYSR